MGKVPQENEKFENGEVHRNRHAKQPYHFSMRLSFKGESHDHKSFPKFKNFTLSVAMT